MAAISSMVSVDLTGHKELLQLLEDIPEKKVKPAIRKVLRAAAKPILAAAKLRSPRRSGAMAKGLTIRAFKRSRKQHIGFWIGTTGKGPAYTGKLFYAWLIERGWRVGKRTAEVRQAQDFARKLSRSPMKLRDGLAAALVKEMGMKQIKPKSVLTVDKRLKQVPGKFIVQSAYNQHAEAQKNFIVAELTKVLNAIKQGG